MAICVQGTYLPNLQIGDIVRYHRHEDVPQRIWGKQAKILYIYPSGLVCNVMMLGDNETRTASYKYIVKSSTNRNGANEVASVSEGANE